MIDKPGIVRHAERCSIICMCWETQQRRECKFPFYDYFRKVDGILFSYANIFFPSGHLKDHIKIAFVFYHCQTDNHKLGSSKQHPFIISPLPQVRSLGVGELGLPCLPWSGVWVWVSFVVCSVSPGGNQEIYQSRLWSPMRLQSSSKLSGLEQFISCDCRTGALIFFLAVIRDHFQHLEDATVPRLEPCLPHGSLLLQGQQESVCYISESFFWLLFLISMLFWKGSSGWPPTLKRRPSYRVCSPGSRNWGCILKCSLPQRWLSASALRFRKVQVQVHSKDG